MSRSHQILDEGRFWFSWRRERMESYNSIKKWNGKKNEKLKEQNTFLEDLFYSNISSNSKSQDEIEISYEDLNNEKVLNDKKNNQENSKR